MNENYQKINQILESLRLSETQPGVMPGMAVSKPLIVGEDRDSLIKELVKLLTVA